MCYRCSIVSEELFELIIEDHGGDIVQALAQLQSGRKLLLGLAAALLLVAAVQLGRGTAPVSVATLGPLLGCLASVWLSEKFAGWQAKFMYSDYDHTARG